MSSEIEDNANAVKPDTNAATKPLFSERETHLLVIAMQSLKSGPPEIDIKRFKDLGGFNTEKTASNTWGKIKNKLLSGGDGASPAMATGSPATAKVVKKGTATPVKRGNRFNDDDAMSSSSPAKKGRKTKPKAEPEFDEDGADF